MPRIKTEQGLLDAYEKQAYKMRKASDKFLTKLEKLVKNLHKMATTYHKEYGYIPMSEDEASFDRIDSRNELVIEAMGIEALIYDYARYREDAYATLIGYQVDYEDMLEELFPLSYLELQDGIANMETMPGITEDDIDMFAREVAEDGGSWRDLLYEIQAAYM